jgi:twitching motility two-component system response regulator PilH
METILIVDDSETERELVGKIVTREGHTPAYAADGDEAVTKAKALKPALIFLDVVMPGKDGFKACRTLKKDPDTQAIPIVLVTMKTSESDRFWGKKQGADDIIPKPFTPDSIVSAIRRFTRG